MSSDDEHVRAMRWLYEDEKSYRKAAAKLKLEELKAHKEKELIRQYRKRQRRIWIGKAQTSLQPALTKIKKETSRKRLAYGVAALVVAGILLAGASILSHNKNNQTKTLGAKTVTPDFKPVAPEDASKNPVTTENNHHKIVTYQDTFGANSLIVSQQKLPDSFKSNPSAITQLEQFKSSEPLDTPKGKLYITSNASGQQWAALTYQDILIFFQTRNRISFDDWYKYIKNLQVK